MNVNMLVNIFPHLLEKCSFDVMTSTGSFLLTTQHMPPCLDWGPPDAQSFIPCPGPTFIHHHTSSIRSLIHEQGKTTAKSLDYRGKLLRHPSRGRTQHCPLTFTGSRSIMRQVRQTEQHVRTPLTHAVWRSGAGSCGQSARGTGGPLATRLGKVRPSTSVPWSIFASLPWTSSSGPQQCCLLETQEGLLHFTSFTGSMLNLLV